MLRPGSRLVALGAILFAAIPQQGDASSSMRGWRGLDERLLEEVQSATATNATVTPHDVGATVAPHDTGNTTVAPVVEALTTGRAMLKIGMDVLRILVIMACFLIMWFLRNFWYTPLANLLGSMMSCPHPLDDPILGWCIADFCCPCFSRPYHKPISMRIVVHSGQNLRYMDVVGNMDCYVYAKCGNNPPKTTSAQNVSGGSSDEDFVTWDEPLDLMIYNSTKSIEIGVYDQDQIGDDDLVGKAKISLNDFLVPSEDLQAAHNKWIELKDEKQTCGALLVSILWSYAQLPVYLPLEQLEMKQR